MDKALNMDIKNYETHTYITNTVISKIDNSNSLSYILDIKEREYNNFKKFIIKYLESNKNVYKDYYFDEDKLNKYITIKTSLYRDTITLNFAIMLNKI